MGHSLSSIKTQQNGHIAVQAEAFSLQNEIDVLRSHLVDGGGDVGAIVNFIGYVRDHYNVGEPHQAKQPNLKGLYLEHYPEMTQNKLEMMRQEALHRFDLKGATIIHRIGHLSLKDPIVLVITAASHRQQAFDGCMFLMDWLKIDAPFWKAEIDDMGEIYWVEQKETDILRKEQWSK